MRPELRTALAFVVGKAIGQQRGGAVYDYAASGYSHFSGHVGDTVSVYDHSTETHLTGNLRNLCSYLTGAHITLSISGRNFSGYDYSSGQHFQGSVNRSNVQIYDYETGKYYHYLVA